VQVLLIPEEECRDILEGGEIPPTNTEKQPKKEPAMNKATAGSTPTTINEQESPIMGQEAQYDEPNILYCQPTSSKIKVEDLVIDEPEGKEQATNASPRPFWDRPVPKPHFEWTYNPRMPPEWNEMVTSMCVYEGSCEWHSKETYRQATSDEVLEPQDLMNQWQHHPSMNDQLWRQSTVQLKLGKQDLEFKELRLQYEKPQAHKMQRNKQEEPENPLANKGKQKEEDMPPARDEYTHLCDRWRKEYVDILGGTQDQLPP
jgi:hypothetical protein